MSGQFAKKNAKPGDSVADSVFLKRMELLGVVIPNNQSSHPEACKLGPFILFLLYSNMKLFILLWIFTASICLADQADTILIEKSKRNLTLFHRNKIIKSYKIALGGTPLGAKTCQGDNKTPEGNYTISAKNNQSSYHKSLRISYPNKDDLKKAKALKCNPGGDIMIHGLPNKQGWIGASHLLYDWTLGCIAVTNQEIDEIWKLVATGTKVEIKP